MVLSVYGQVIYFLRRRNTDGQNSQSEET